MIRLPDSLSAFRIRELTPRQLRRNGVLLLLLAAPAAALGGYLFWISLGAEPTLLIELFGGRYDPPPGQVPSPHLGAAVLTGFLFAVGLIAVAMALYQLATGRRLLGLLRVLLAMLAVFMVAGVAAAIWQGEPVGRIRH